MSAREAVTVAPTDWVSELAALKGQGLTVLDVLTVVDRIESLELVACLVDPDTGRTVLVTSTVPSDESRVPSAVSVFPGAAWHEREAAEMFGIAFIGHPDPRPLLLHEAVDAPPLRKSTPLPARVAMTWPGAAEADASRRARRPQLPPGVRAEWMAEDAS